MYFTVKKRTSTVRNNPEETSEEIEDDDDANIFEILGNMQLFCDT